LYAGDNHLNLKTSNHFIELSKLEDVEILEFKNPVDIHSLIREHRPEIVIIEENVLPDEQILDSLRTNHCNPFKVVLLEQGELLNINKQLEYIKMGADEVLVKSDSAQEIFLKCFAYLRRREFLQLNDLTGLPSLNKTYSVIDHCRKNLSDWVLMHIDMHNIKSYNLMYGVSKGDQAIKETANVLKEAVIERNNSNGFVGYLGRDNFVIICDSNSMDKFIQKINTKFLQILSKLYKEADYKSGFIICAAPNRIRRKEGLLSLNIGTCNNIDRNYLSATDVIEQAIQNKKPATSHNKKVLIFEDDTDFAELIAETLDREGLESIVSKGFDHLVEEVKKIKPKILILEASTMGAEQFVSLCKQLEPYKKELGLKILVATNTPGYQSFLIAGADIYVPKPYDLEVLFREVRRLRFTTV
jgi:DNA-binding response OmpR family regulator